MGKVLNIAHSVGEKGHHRGLQPPQGQAAIGDHDLENETDNIDIRGLRAKTD